jgi:hypothetical protein
VVFLVVKRWLDTHARARAQKSALLLVFDCFESGVLV